jgi:hypothetical protein
VSTGDEAGDEDGLYAGGGETLGLEGFPQLRHLQRRKRDPQKGHNTRFTVSSSLPNTAQRANVVCRGEGRKPTFILLA